MSSLLKVKEIILISRRLCFTKFKNFYPLPFLFDLKDYFFFFVLLMSFCRIQVPDKTLRLSLLAQSSIGFWMPLGPAALLHGIFIVNLLLLGELFCKQTNSIASSSETCQASFYSDCF